MPDMPGHDATRRDDLHTMTLKELEVKIMQAGIVMSRRQIMRHCEGDTFDAKKLPALNNVDEWFIAPASVENGIADIKALREHRVRRDATRRDTANNGETKIAPNDNTVTPGHDATRPVMSEKEKGDRAGETEPDMSRYVGQLEKRIEEKDEVIGMLRGELVHRNEEIVRRNERERETNILIRGLQNLVLRLQPGTPPSADVLDGDAMAPKREVVDQANL
jgi:hypothetical protein